MSELQPAVWALACASSDTPVSILEGNLLALHSEPTNCMCGLSVSYHNRNLKNLFSCSCNLNAACCYIVRLQCDIVATEPQICLQNILSLHTETIRRNFASFRYL